MTKRRIATEPRRFWTADEDALFRALYPEHRTEDLLPRFPGRSLRGLYARAKSLGIEKSEAFKASPASGRTNGRQGMGTRFVKGQTPVNKGKKCEPGRGGRHPNARRTHFKPGEKSWRTMPLGHVREVAGYLYTKIADTPNVAWTRNWKATHIVNWEAVNGPLSVGYVLKCADGNVRNVAASNWTAIPRALLPRLNGGRWGKKLAYDDAPTELKPSILAVAKLEHAVREKVGA